MHDATSLQHDLKDLLMKGGFHISKWISNSRDVMSLIPVSERAKEVKDLDLDNDTLPIDRALGIRWCAESDVFCFKIEIENQPLTRRGILSMVSSIFDPLGFLAPFTMKAKCLLQELCKLQLGWDKKIPENLTLQWNDWLKDLERLTDFSIRRCCKPPGFGEIRSAQLHHFADASECGYGTVSYLRLENHEGTIHCSYINGKSCVAPLKQITIPRLELTAATVAVRIDKMLKSELQVPIDKTVFWTDSMTVLRYIGNTSARFYTFVANRLTVIHEGSQPDQWRYISTKLNPADLASRGISTKAMLQKQWITEPEFLSKSEEYWPENPMKITMKMLDRDPEIKTKCSTVQATIKDSSCVSADDDHTSVDKIINYHSSWYKLKKSVAWILKIRSELLHRVRQRKHVKSEDQVSLVAQHS